MPFTTTIALILALITIKPFSMIHKHSSGLNRIDHIDSMTKTSHLFLLQDQRTNFANRRKWLNQQDLAYNIPIAII